MAPLIVAAALTSAVVATVKVAPLVNVIASCVTRLLTLAFPSTVIVGSVAATLITASSPAVGTPVSQFSGLRNDVPSPPPVQLTIARRRRRSSASMRSRLRRVSR